MNYQPILDKVNATIDCAQLPGSVATYIPELAKVDPNKFGMYLCCISGSDYSVGDAHEQFTIQSVSKVLTLSLALIHEGETLWKRVGVEPSGNPFNSLIQLEYENGIPRNPLINAGAIVICDILLDHLQHPKSEYLEFINHIAGTTITFDKKVAESEKSEGHHNRAIAYLMKGYKNIHNDIEEVLDFYFYCSAISMSCQELAKTFKLFSTHGKLTNQGDEQILSEKRTRRINALMQTCGFYDEAGEFTFRVGLPGKSGVGGGIAAIYPGKYSTAVWSPKLNEKGNSTAGMLALELLTDMTGSSIF